MARLVLSNGVVIKDVQVIKVAVGGVVKNVTRSLVVHEGVIRQYFPQTGTDINPAILWTPVPLTVHQSVDDPSDSVASISFGRSTGFYTHDNYPDAPLSAQFLSPSLDGTAGDDGKFLIRADQTSGDALTGTLGSWVDLNADFVVSLDEAIVGTLNAVANISISQDNGGGSPLSETTVVKAVTFISTVRTASNIGWSTTQRDLVEVKSGEDADCILTLDADGTSSGSADTSGSFNETWLLAGGDPTDMTVEFTLISGTQPTGTSFDVALPLDQRRQVILLATTGEDFSCEFDVTVVDDVESVVKRVTMNSQRSVAAPDPVWDTDDWNLSDVTGPQPLGLLVDFTVNFQFIGLGEGSVDSQGIGEIQESDDWLPVAETATDYEVKVRKVSGIGVLLAPFENNVWYRMTEQRAFVIESTTLSTPRLTVFEASVRRIGTIGSSRLVNMTSAADNGEQPP